MTSTEQKAKTFFYVMTVQGSWGRNPTSQVTISGTITNEAHKTREAIYNYLFLTATQAWRDHYRGISTNDFAVLFFSFEEDTL